MITDNCNCSIIAGVVAAGHDPAKRGFSLHKNPLNFKVISQPKGCGYICSTKF